MQVRVANLADATEHVDEVVMEVAPKMTMVWMALAVGSLVCALLSFELDGGGGVFGAPHGDGSGVGVGGNIVGGNLYPSKLFGASL